MIRSLFDGSGQLAQGNHRHFHLSGDRLQGPGDLRDLLLSGIRTPAASGTHQLQVVDHDAVQTIFQLHSPALAPKFGDRDARRIIDHQIRFADHVGAVDQTVPLGIHQTSGTELAGLYICLLGKQSVDQLFLGHLQGEDRHMFMFMKCHVGTDIECECSLAHGGSCGDQDQVRRLESAGLEVQIRESR